MNILPASHGGNLKYNPVVTPESTGNLPSRKIFLIPTVGSYKSYMSKSTIYVIGIERREHFCLSCYSYSAHNVRSLNLLPASLSFGRKIESEPREKRDRRTCDLLWYMLYNHPTCSPLARRNQCSARREKQHVSMYQQAFDQNHRIIFGLKINVRPCHNCILSVPISYIDDDRCDSLSYDILVVDGKFRV